ncbi:UbiA family prenyltransferase [Tardisphaera saccharovorans]|nr:prenyltransferase [TACK group archaeon]
MGIKSWIMAPRPQYFPITILPVLLSTSLSYYEFHELSITYAVLTYVVGMLLQGFTHVTNDYFDVKYGTDLPGSPTTKYRRHPILSGDMSMREIAYEAVGLAVIAAALGVFFVLEGRSLAIVLGLGAAILCLEYTAPPIKAKYRALNQVIMFILEGPYLTLGGFYLQTGRITALPIIASLPLAFIMCEVLLLDDMKDVDFDRKVGVHTIPTLFGNKVAGRVVTAELLSAYASLALLVAFRVIPLLCLIAMATFPLLYWNLRVVVKELPPTTGLKSMVVSLIFGCTYALAFVF